MLASPEFRQDLSLPATRVLLPFTRAHGRMFISWAAVSCSSSWGILVSLILDSGHPPNYYLAVYPLCSPSPAWQPFGREERSIPPLLSTVALVSQPPPPPLIHMQGCQSSKHVLSPCICSNTPISCAYISTHMYILNLPLAASVRSVSTRFGPWIFQRKISLPI